MLFNNIGLKSRNLNIIGLSNFVAGFLFFIPILALYLQKELFTLTNVSIIFAIQSIIAVILEVPTGAFADLYGRKTSKLIGQILFFIGIIFLSIGGNFMVFVLYALLSGAGGAFLSGTDGAIIYDTLKQERKQKYYKKVNGLLQAIWPFGAIFGFIIGGYLAKYSLSLPVTLSLFPLGMALSLIFFIQEPKYTKSKHKSIFLQMHESIKLIFSKRQLILLLGAALVIMAFGESAHNLKPVFFEFKNIPIEYFGWIFSAISGLSVFGYYYSHNFSERFGNKFTLILTTLLFSFFIILATLTQSWISISLLALTSVLYGLRGPVLDHMTNIEVESNKRATILSASNLAQTLGMALVAPLLGYLADLWSINTAYLIAGVSYLIAVILFLLIGDRK